MPGHHFQQDEHDIVYVRFRFFKLTDFAFPVVLAWICLCLFILIKPLVTLHVAVFAALGVYILTVWRLGERFMGPITQKGPSEPSPELS